MYAFAAYTAVAVVGALSAQALRPHDALAHPHHQRIYWVGALAGVGLAVVYGSLLIE